MSVQETFILYQELPLFSFQSESALAHPEEVISFGVERGGAGEEEGGSCPLQDQGGVLDH